MKARSTAGKWLEWACGGRCRIADVAPIVIRYTGDGASLLMEMAVDYQKNQECGDNADFIRYFSIVWLIELKSLWGKGFVDFQGAACYAVCRWPAALFAENCRDKMWFPDYVFMISAIYLFCVCIIFS
ncbi:hypothetical protein [Burkholderia sp. SIMBA_062]|uniref:hypothetical protein n=1 Tax=Burkholderia sp. SIMBA_062 TaxID=3085803 RepID=UPI0039797B68